MDGAVPGMQVLEHLCGRDSFHKEAILFWSNEIIRKKAGTGDP
jgi:hypothetical protein